MNKRTSSARLTFGFPFSNKIWTICSCPLKAAIQRGVIPFFTFKKIEKWETKKKKEKERINKRNNQQNNTLSGRSTFGFPFSNKIWTICSCPFSEAI